MSIDIDFSPFHRYIWTDLRIKYSILFLIERTPGGHLVSQICLQIMFDCHDLNISLYYNTSVTLQFKGLGTYLIGLRLCNYTNDF